MPDDGIKSGRYFMQGNVACAEGALAAGCRFFAGYPITPATEIAEHMARRLPGLNGVYIQMEDEIGSIASVIGASWTGKLAMTATSGPGLSLMQENIGYAVATETPCVIVDVQRGGPSTGIPAVPMQGDMVQVRRGSHGEYESIAFAPASVQEMFDLTIRAFNIAEMVRMPVFVMADAALGHMREPVVIPEAEEILTVNRKMPEPGTPPQEIRGFLDDDVAPMPVFGHGFKAHVTGSCHDAYGMRNVVEAEALDSFVRTLQHKVEKKRDQVMQIDAECTEDAEVVLIGYGLVGRAAKGVARQARHMGLRVGSLRPVTVWPFADREIRALCQHARRVLVMENNLGQMLPYVQAAVHGSTDVIFMPPQVLGTLHRPQDVIDKIREVL